MKYLLFIAVALLIASCKTDGVLDELPTKDKRQAVTFDVIGISQSAVTSTTSIRLKETRGYDNSLYLKYGIEDVMFLVFDSKGNSVSRYQQTSGLLTDTLFRILKNDKQIVSTSLEFGKLTDSLLAGDYTLLVVGCPKYLMYNKDVSRVPNQDLFPPFPVAQTFLDYKSAQVVRPVYTYKGSFKVGDAASINDVVLNRIGGDLQIVLEDVMPNNARLITATVNFEFTGYNFGTGLPAINSEPSIFGAEVKAENYGKRAFTFSHYLLNTPTPFDVIVNCYGDANQVIATKKITGAKVDLNSTKVLYTKLFD